jgi:hypothetical protein
MDAPENLPAQIAEKPNDELIEMLRHPHFWLSETLDLAEAELQRRGVSSLAAATPLHADAPNLRPTVRHHIHITKKAFRYGLVFTGCVAQTIIIRVIASVLMSSDATQPHLALKQLAVFGLLAAWPVWCVPLWYCGWRRVVSVAIPMIIGLAILWPLGDALLFAIGIMAGGHT